MLDVEDILEEVNVRAIQRQPLQHQIGLPGLAEVSGDEALVLKHLSAEPAHVDALRRSAGLSIATVSSTGNPGAQGIGQASGSNKLYPGVRRRQLTKPSHRLKVE